MRMRRYTPTESEQLKCPFCRSSDFVRHYGGFETMNYYSHTFISPVNWLADEINPVMPADTVKVQQATHMIGYKVVCERCQEIIMDCGINWQTAHRANVGSDPKRFFEVLYGTAA